jgi:hypothetical protein
VAETGVTRGLVRWCPVATYIKSRQVRAEISHCQRWIELRIGEWLGPAKEGFKGNQYSASSPGEEAKIHDRHKYEFRLLAQHKALAIEILEKYDGQVITRAMLLAELGEATLRERADLKPR